MSDPSQGSACGYVHSCEPKLESDSHSHSRKIYLLVVRFKQGFMTKAGAVERQGLSVNCFICKFIILCISSSWFHLTHSVFSLFLSSCFSAPSIGPSLVLTHLTRYPFILLGLSFLGFSLWTELRAFRLVQAGGHWDSSSEEKLDQNCVGRSGTIYRNVSDHGFEELSPLSMRWYDDVRGLEQVILRKVLHK